MKAKALKEAALDVQRQKRRAELREKGMVRRTWRGGDARHSASHFSWMPIACLQRRVRHLTHPYQFWGRFLYHHRAAIGVQEEAQGEAGPDREQGAAGAGEQGHLSAPARGG